MIIQYIKKMFVMLMVFLFISTTAQHIIFDDNGVIVSAYGDISNIGFDLGLIYNVTEYLSNIIYTSYSPGELQKSRAFGSKGEHDAADYLVDTMNAIGLNNIHKERITNISGDDPIVKITRDGDGTLTTKLDIIGLECMLNNSGMKTSVDCYISPRWNESIHNQEYNKNLLTHIFSYRDLKIVKTDYYTCTDDYLKDVFVFITGHGLLSIIAKNIPLFNEVQDLQFLRNISGAMEEEFQQYYDFTFGNIDPEDNLTFPSFLRDETVPEDGFVFIEECPKFHPTIQELPSLEDDPAYNELYTWTLFVRKTFFNLRMRAWYETYPNCKGLIWYDYLDDAYDTGQSGMYLPIIYVNGSIGNQITDNIDDFTLDFFIDQHWNTSVESYNVIGEITGKDPSKTVIVGCLYDSMWCQGTVDSAIGVGIMLSIAKYMKELETTYGILPKYTVKFIGYGGEEAGYLGAYHYEFTHRDEDIYAVIDLNQLGYNQSYPPSIFNVASNAISLVKFPLYRLNKIVENVRYTERTGTEWRTLYTPLGSLSDEFPFAIAAAWPPVFKTRPLLRTILFLKDMGWYRHHRTGMNHTEGDSMKYVDWNDVNVTAEMVWNVTKYFTIDPDASFQSTPSVIKHDTNGDSYYDKVTITFTANTTMPQDRIKIRAVLHPVFSLAHPLWWLLFRYQDVKEYTITRNQGITDTLTISLPPDAPQSNYQLHVFLYNSTGDVNIILDNQNDRGLYANHHYKPAPFYMHPPTSPPTIPDTVVGPQTVLRLIQYHYSTYSSIESGRIYYQFNWRANKIIPQYSRWYGPYNSGELCTAYHAWLMPGEYDVRVRAKDRLFNPNTVTPWSEPLRVTVTSWGGGGADGCGDGGGASGSSEQFYTQLCSIVTTQTVGAEYSYHGDPYGQMGQQGKSQGFEWFWDFGDGTYSNEQYPTHAYSTTGEKLVTLRINDTIEDDFCILKIPVDVVILKADYMVNPQAAQPNVTLFFNDTSAGGHPIVDWYWDFDDGTYSTQRNTSHSFDEPGVYNVSLTVTDSHVPSNSDTYTKTIHIEETLPTIISVNQSALTLEPNASIIIDAAAADTQSGLQTILINITYPDGLMKNITLTPSTDNLFEDYTVTFDETNQTGQYNYTVIAVDYADNINISPVFSFLVSTSPNTPADPYPADEAQNVELSPRLSVYVSDLEGDLMNVSFYEWTPEQYFLIDSENQWNPGTHMNTTADGQGNLILDSKTDIYGDGSNGGETQLHQTKIMNDIIYQV